ncbi:MAG: hypothetical protein ABIJ57_02430 [Pseudomonadota bacterium]
MKRFMVLVVGLVFLFCTSAIAAEKAKPAAPAAPAAAEPAKAEVKAEKKEVKKEAKKKAKKEAEMSAAGKVMEISDTVLRIERTLKGKVETMEFYLEKPFLNIKVGEQIRVNYREKEGRNVLLRVAPAKKTAVQKTGKEAPKETKPVVTKKAPKNEEPKKEGVAAPAKK